MVCIIIPFIPQIRRLRETGDFVSCQIGKFQLYIQDYLKHVHALEIPWLGQEAKLLKEEP